MIRLEHVMSLSETKEIMSGDVAYKPFAPAEVFECGTLAEAFRYFVLDDPGVTQLRATIDERFWPVLDQGKFPSHEFAYYWHLHTTAEQLYWRFVLKSIWLPPMVGYDPRPPNEVRTIS